MKQAIWCSSKSISKRLLSLVICSVFILALCACKDSSGGESKLPMTPSDNTSSEDVVEDTVSVDPISGEITVTGSIEAIEEEKKVEQNVQILDADLSSSDKGYAEKEANARRKEILNTANTEKLYIIKGTKYYISPKGDDNNDGLSPSTAFKTIDAAQKVDLKEGDAVLFERGAVYRFKHAIAVKSGVTYGSYGKGDKPAIYGSPMNFAESKWVPSKKKNVWYAEYLYGTPSGAFFDHGKVAGRLINAGIGALQQNGDFYHDAFSGYLYIYCDEGNPANVYKSIEVSPSAHIFSAMSGGCENVVIDNICIKYGSYGFAGGGSDNLYITNCEFGYIGGLVGSDVRRGNAIEVMGNSSNLHFDHNWIYQTFDTAISWQSYSSATYKDISFSDNLLEYNNADFEFWEVEDSVIDGFVMDNNIMRFTSKGWGTRSEDGGIRGIEGCFNGDVSKMKINGTIDITNNIIDCPGRQIVWLNAQVDQKSKFKFSGNKVYVKGSYRTTNEIINEFPDNFGNAKKVMAKNSEELKAALSIFDPTAKVIWYD